MCSIYDDKYKNNVCNFRIGDIVRFKDAAFDGHLGEMRVVDMFVEVKHKRNKTRKTYMYNYLHLVPKDFCEKCTGEDDLRYFDVCRTAFEGHIYKIK